MLSTIAVTANERSIGFHICDISSVCFCQISSARKMQVKKGTSRLIHFASKRPIMLICRSTVFSRETWLPRTIIALPMKKAIRRSCGVFEVINGSKTVFGKIFRRASSVFLKIPVPLFTAKKSRPRNGPAQTTVNPAARKLNRKYRPIT